MFNVNLDRVQRVYSGKRGCMCGCLGKYTATSWAAKEVGDDAVNDKVAKRHLNMVLSFVGPVRPDSNDRVSYSTDHGYVARDVDGRTYAAYFA